MIVEGIAVLFAVLTLAGSAGAFLLLLRRIADRIAHRAAGLPLPGLALADIAALSAASFACYAIARVALAVIEGKP